MADEAYNDGQIPEVYGVWPEPPIFPIAGTCARCLREREDLFWHRQDDKLYCADVFRCEARYIIQGEREAQAS